MSLNGDTAPRLGLGDFSTNASLRLQVNTRNSNTTFGVAVNTVKVRVAGDFGADGFDFDGAFSFTAAAPPCCQP